MPIIRVTARVYVHATEEKDRVMKALMNVFPRELWGDVEVREEKYEGHYGNPIIVLEAGISDPQKALQAFKNIVNRLDEADRRYLLASLEERVDKNGTLYIRLSKQQAYLGSLRVFEADDVVRVAVAFQGSRRKALKEYHELIAGV